MKSHCRSKVRHPRVEALLQRVLLSVSAVKETLTIEGMAGKDVISLSVAPETASQMTVTINGDERLFRLGRFKVININALGGNDTVRIGNLGSGHPAYLNIDLGAGHDRVYGSPGAERIVGGNGNDRIAAGAGADYVNAGNGDDVVTGDAGRDTLIGLTGKDSLYGGDGNDSIFGGDDADSLDGTAGDDTINGGSGDDQIIENDPAVKSPSKYYDKIDFKNVIDGAGGDDYIEIRGYGGLSRVYGGEGNDYLVGQNQFTNTYWRPSVYGGNGNDKLIGAYCYGGTGNDKIASVGVLYGITLNGDEGDDVITSTIDRADGGTISGGGGNDTINNVTMGLDGIDGGDGNDEISAQSGRADGGAGNDLIYGSGADDTLRGGNGDDTLHGQDGNDWLIGGEGRDLLYGGNSTDTLSGGAGDDSLSGGGYKDKVRSDDGRDFLSDREGKDRLDPIHDWWDKDYPPYTGGGYGGVVVSPAGGGSGVVFTVTGDVNYVGGT